jgi:hypothetical protein
MVMSVIVSELTVVVDAPFFFSYGSFFREYTCDHGETIFLNIDL